MGKDRGFKEITGAMITKINVSAVNEVILYDSNTNTRYIIEAEIGPLGIPEISLRVDNNVS